MKKYPVTVIVLILLLAMACKDEEIPPPATLTFATRTTIATETEGPILITVNLDKPAFRDIVVDFTIEGSAQGGIDYETTATATIANGDTTGALLITLIDDTDFEFDRELIDQAGILGETVKISIARITGNALPPENGEGVLHLLVIKDDEPVAKSLSIDLSWDSGDGTPGDVDMDLVLFLLDPTIGPRFLAASATIGTGFEKIAIGTPAPDGLYGLAIRYYEGASDNVTFTVKFTPGNGTLPGGATESSHMAVYTQANINGEENNPVQIVLTFEKKGPDYLTFSEIAVPASGSRGRGVQGTLPRDRSQEWHRVGQ